MGKQRKVRHKGAYESECLYANGTLYAKVCTHCGETKLIEDFHKDGKDADGSTRYRDECRLCYNVKRKENRGSNKHAEFVGHQRHRGERDIDYSYTEWRETVIYFGGMCAYCGRTMRKGEYLTRDHLTAYSDGGKTEQGNIVPACTSCNCSKGNKDWRDWLMAQSFFSQERMNKIFQWKQIVNQICGE